VTLRSDILEAHKEAQKRARALVREVKRELRSADDMLRARLLTALTGRRTLSQVNKLTRNVAILRGAVFVRVQQLLEEALSEFAHEETQSARADLDLQGIPRVPAVSSERIRGRTLRSWVDGIRRSDRDRLEAEIHMGVAEGARAEVITQRIMGTVRARGRDGALGTAERQLTPLTTTAIMHFFSVVRGDAAAKAGLDERYETLPGKTESSDVCRKLDGTVFEAGEGPRPPQHFNCKSVRIPLLEENRNG